jgi:hypothetical protein
VLPIEPMFAPDSEKIAAIVVGSVTGVLSKKVANGHRTPSSLCILVKIFELNVTESAAL